jgi:hypothetical protein
MRSKRTKAVTQDDATRQEKPFWERHTAASIFPMMSDQELHDLAEDIKQNGLVHPIVVDKHDGNVVIDGWNRLKACEIASFEPQFVDYEGDDPRAFIIANNVRRRHLSKGQQAMAVAMLYPEAETPFDRGKKGGHGKTSSEPQQLFSPALLSHARTVLRWSRELANEVMTGTMGLHQVYKTAMAKRHEGYKNAGATRPPRIEQTNTGGTKKTPKAIPFKPFTIPRGQSWTIVPAKAPGGPAYIVPVDEPADEAKKRRAGEVNRQVQCLADSLAETTAEDCVQQAENRDELVRQFNAIVGFATRVKEARAEVTAPAPPPSR